MSATGNNNDRTLGVDTIDGHQAAVYISQMGHCTEVKLTADELKTFIKDCQKVLAQLEPKPKRKKQVVYKRWEEAQAALDRGETSVAVKMDYLPFNPLNLIQMAQDMHDRERIALWKLKQQEGDE